jgi:hypothetical protein
VPDGIALFSNEPVLVSAPDIQKFLSTARAVDIVDLAPKVTNNAPATFPIGATVVTFIATDTSGNRVTGQATVIIRVPAPDIRVGAVDVRPGEVEVGQPVVVSIIVENLGRAAGSRKLTINLDGRAISQPEVFLDPGQMLTIRREVLEEVVGAHIVSVEGVVVTFEVKVADRADLRLVPGSLTIEPQRTVSGATTIAVVTVINKGGRPGVLGLVLRVDGQFAQIRTVTLQPGELRSVEFKVTGTAAGRHTLSIVGQVEDGGVEPVETGSFEVLPVLVADLTYTALTVAPEKVGSGEPVTITITLDNTGRVKGSRLVVVRVDDRPAVLTPETVIISAADLAKVEFVGGQLSATLEPGEKVTLSLRVVERSPGLHQVIVDGRSKTFEVDRAAPLRLVIAVLAVLLALLVTGLAAMLYYRTHRAGHQQRRL